MKQLIEEYKKGKVILFVGAGVSANLKIPTWSELINKIASDLGYDPEVFKTYGDFLSLAEYYKIENGGLGKLRSWMDREWHNTNVDITQSKIHKLIAQGNFPLIYTTNYENWIENAHEHYSVPFNKIVTVKDISEIDSSKKEIIKFHGDFTEENSIVLDETSYFNRLEFETPLDLKLRSDVLGKSVLFIGYRLGDVNIRHIFFKLSKLWENHGNGMERPKSYMFTSKLNPIQKTVLQKWNIETLNNDIDDAGLALEKFLEELTAPKL
jgi:hypothetical protein